MPAQHTIVVPSAKDVNLYEILGLPPPGRGSIVAAEEIKAAYRRALLKYHPDKLSRHEAVEADSTNTSSSTSEDARFSIDDVRKAYQVLSAASSRREYDQDLLLTSDKAESSKSGIDQRTTELEVLDLDELNFDDVEGVYYTACRCGNPRGFAVSEDDLLDDKEDATVSLGEVLLECPDCSHHVRVAFSLMEDE